MIGAAGVLLLFLLSAFAYDKTQSDRVAKGVTIGGIDVSGLSADDAKQKLKEELAETYQRPIVVSYEGKTRTLKPDKSEVHVDVEGMVNEAVDKSNQGFFVANAVRNAVGSSRDITIPTEITYSKRAVRRFVRSVSKSYNRAPVDATIKYSAKGIGEVDEKPGLAVRQARLTEQIDTRLQDPQAPRRIKLPVKETKAKITRDELADKYSTIIVVDRKGFKLRLYKKLKLSKKYGIAVGQAGLETPAGLYSIQNKQVNPTWNVPNSDWAGDLAGKSIPPGPGNPLIARWLGIYNGVGIHGTSDTGSIGSNASHGCIRMIPDQVIDLYDRVPVGTPVFIG